MGYLATNEGPITTNAKSMANSAERVGEKVKTYAHDAADAAASGVDTIVDKSVAISKKAVDAVPNMESWLETKLDATRETVRAEPFKAIAISAGIGAVLGFLLLRR